MKVFRFIHRLTAFVGVALLMCAMCCEDMSAIHSFAKWGVLFMIPSVLYMACEKVFGGEDDCEY